MVGVTERGRTEMSNKTAFGYHGKVPNQEIKALARVG